MKVVLAGVVGTGGLLALFLSAVWALFMHKFSEPFSVTGPYFLDYLVLAALLASGLSLVGLAHVLTSPWPRQVSWFLRTVVTCMALALVWADTPLSSCAYLPASPSKCTNPIPTAYPEPAKSVRLGHFFR